MDSSLTITIVEWFLLLSFASFMPLTCVSFIRYRLQRKEAEYLEIINILGLKKDRSLETAIRSEYSYKDYAMPVGLAFVLTLLGMFTMFFSQKYGFAKEPNLILLGSYIPKNSEDLYVYQSRSILAITMAFLGAYVWSVQNIFRRLATIDLPPRAYYTVSIRMILAVSVALMFRLAFEPLFSYYYSGELLPVISFLTGIFPERLLFAISSRIHFFSEKPERNADKLPLEMIEGISIFHKVRLSELGIDNAQNLAEANFIALMIRSPFNPSQLIDWIGQAKLYLYFKTDICKLRSVGIRTAFDYIDLDYGDELWSDLSNNTGVSVMQLKNVYRIFQCDPCVKQLKKAGEILRQLSHSRFGISE